MLWPDDKKKFLLSGFFVISVLGSLSYSNSFQGSFQFDDVPAIVENYQIQDITDLRRIFRFYPQRFVTFYTFALNYHFHQFDVFGYHLVNWIIHILATFLVWGFVFLTFSFAIGKDDTMIQYQHEIALSSALIFLCHPIQTQAVAYIHQRFTSLASVFYLASVCFYIKGRASIAIKKILATTYFILSAMMAFLGMFTKELMITLPLTLIVYESCFLRKTQKTQGTYRKVFLYILIFLFILIIPAMYHFDIMGRLSEPRVSESHTGEIITCGKYVLTQFRVIMLSIRLLFLPINQNVDYDISLSQSLWEWPTFLSVIAVVLLIFYAAKIRARHPLICFGIVWFFMIYSYNFIPRQNIFFEHNLYLPSVGFSMVLCVGLYKITQNLRRFTIMISVILCLFSYLTFKRNKVWQDPIALWSDVIHKSPQKARGYNAIGAIFLKRGDYDTASSFFQKAVEVDPYFAYSYLNWGNVYKLKGQYEEALANYAKALEVTASFAKADIYNNRGNAYHVMKQYALALEDYNQALYIQSGNFIILNNRGAVYRTLEKYDLALADFNKAIELNPRFAEAYNNRGSIYVNQKQYDLAIADYNKALSISPNYAEAYNNRGTVYVVQRQYDLAIANYSQAITINPKYVKAYYNRGTAFREQGKYDLAIADFNKILSSDANFAPAYLGRSLCYQALGDTQHAFDDAVKAKSLGLPVDHAYVEQLEEKLSE